MIGRKTLEDRIAATIRAEFAVIIEDLKSDHEAYLCRLKLKEATKAEFESTQAEVQRLHSERIALKKRFWETYYAEEKDERALAEVESQSSSLERTITRAEKALKRTRADFEEADFDEVAESFALRAKANVIEEEINHRVEALEKSLDGLLTKVRSNIKEAGKALREEYKEPHFDTPEERDAHLKKMIEVLNAVAESYAPGE